MDVLAPSLNFCRLVSSYVHYLILWQNNVESKREGVQYMQVYRSREVGQSYITSIGTTIVASMHALWIVLKLKPQVVLLFSLQKRIL
jgi:beta-1,4-N-acetylglucosaminyltransferase